MKEILNDVTNIDSLQVINDNFDKIEEALQERVLYRDNPVGEPNTMENALDMNGFDILNAGDIFTDTGRLATIDELEAIRDEVEQDRAEVEANRSLAQSAANTAASAATSASNLFDNFDDRYLGPKASDPAVDNDGNTLLTGALYFRTGGTPLMRVYNGSAWQDVASTSTTTVNTIDPSLYATVPEAEAGTNNTKVMTPLRVANYAAARGFMDQFSNQTVGGIKSFSSSVNVPAAFFSGQAVNKGQMDAVVNNMVIPTYKNLRIETTTGSQLTIKADSVVLTNPAEPPLVLNGVNLTVDVSTEGLGGVQSSSFPPTGLQWFSLWIVSNSVATFGLIAGPNNGALSPPIGYAWKQRVGMLFIYNSGTPVPKPYKQSNEDVYFKCDGSVGGFDSVNISALGGDPFTPVLSSLKIRNGGNNVIPYTAQIVKLNFVSNLSTAHKIAITTDPSSGGVNSTNKPPAFIFSSDGTSPIPNNKVFELELIDDNIYTATTVASGSTNPLFFIGYKDNL